MKSLLTLGIICMLGIASCTSDNEEDTFSGNNNNGGCDTTNVSFTKIIMPLIQNNCLSCHNSTSPVLSNYDQISKNATRILGAIKHQPGFRSMPPGGKLPDCSIAQFEAWVNQGKKNN
ncbi:MAG: hypothetical protein N2662_07530 [Bacteroidales bacterium]|nr:hypothetical protein [Bacteroidales bacterium]